tara:strand:+ start:2026 stop:2838 length:813 start_codon:yes stop_codon:yes gene_type:complete
MKLAALLLLMVNCITLVLFPQSDSKDQILETYLEKGAWQHHYLSKEWEEWIDKGLAKDSTIAYLWQQKALPYWKQKKYSQAINFYQKAVKYDEQRWLSRLAFLKCIFAKDFKNALLDFKKYKISYGSTYEQDHPIELYIGICYLQLNEFDKALVCLSANLEMQEQQFGKSWVPVLDYYYLGIAYYELSQFEEAIKQFNAILKEHPTFSDALFYKSLCLKYLGNKEKAIQLMAYGKEQFEAGNTFQEDSNKYESYPYQITWQWSISKYLLN